MNKEECELACLYLLGHCYEEKEIEIFKELINKYFELKEKLEKNCLVSNMARDIEKLEKALDKACDRLDFFDHLYGDDEYEDWKTKEQWKEWCLKDVE